ncbi:hypothetical protein KP509_06G043500 [Ceratopteris richardii]|uniref:Plastocyanin-like domain-containing protein n=1 Tax=Ceratopteris richardii TaxID=49495 RepID=A0A8T2UFZ2_CERRI|nr:hypothetical protein KP509_06G043500 [Ceratopteris richardii]
MVGGLPCPREQYKRRLWEDSLLQLTVQTTNVTRLCYTKVLLTVNGQFPGPTSYVREGDKVVVNVSNLSSYDVTIHWHGVRQLLSCWADGPAYITQCPIKTNQSYVHRFRIIDQRGTLFWHAHQSWLRASIHGAFIILKKNKVGYPFDKPTQEPPPLDIKTFMLFYWLNNLKTQSKAIIRVAHNCFKREAWQIFVSREKLGSKHNEPIIFFFFERKFNNAISKCSLYCRPM